MAKIGIDCDGVLANFIRAFVAEVNRIWPGRLPADFEPDDWDMKGSGLTGADIKLVWERIKGTQNWWLQADAYSDNVGDLAMWFNTHYGNEVWVVTSRAETLGFGVAHQTKMWLDACGVLPQHNYFGVIVVPDKDDKIDILSRLDIRWMIDDHAETIESMDRFPYMRAALLDRPWNQHADVKWRVKSVGEYLAKVGSAPEAQDDDNEHAVRSTSGAGAAGVGGEALQSEAGHARRAVAISRRD